MLRDRLEGITVSGLRAVAQQFGLVDRLGRTLAGGHERARSLAPMSKQGLVLALLRANWRGEVFAVLRDA